MSIFRLRGGVHPKGQKHLAAERPIRALPIPAILYVPLQQHIGAGANPVVAVGDRVRKGQLLASNQGMISAPVHAPTSGRVTAIIDHPSSHPSGLPLPTVVLEADGDDRWHDADPPADPCALSPEEISVRVGAAGIVGLGGAVFPSAVKLNLSRRSRVRTLILNGGECEPYLTCDDRLMRERAAQIVTGIRLIQRATGAGRVLIGIENNKPEAIAAMRTACAATGVEVAVVPAMYPMGSEKQLIVALTGLEVPAGGRPADIGMLVHNVGTAHAVQQAIELGRPLVSRVVTVSGGAVAAPGNVEAVIGTPVRALFDACGGWRTEPVRLVMGGPMMGQQLRHLDVPVIKGTSGVLALTAREISRQTEQSCIRCSSCVRACPVGLLPLEMSSRICAGDLNAAVGYGLKDCIGCGSCSYVCPAHIPLVQYFNYAKGELAARERTKLKQEATRKLADERSARLERIARERAEAAARRKAAKQASATPRSETAG